MSSCFDTSLACVLLGISVAAVAADDFPGIGRTATSAEIKAWDIDVRPDFLGLPPGSGSVRKGREVFAAKCAACHGAAGESSAMFNPLIGGTTPTDIATGQVHDLLTTTSPFQRTLFMKVATLSSVFDYIQRAMPWTQPKSLAPDEVYAVLAYLLNLAAVVPEDFTLSNSNIAAAQQRLPNRNGMTTDHGLWPGAPANKSGIGNGGRPDVHAVACMKDCAVEVRLGPPMPEVMRKAAGNPDEQNRSFGGVRGTPLNAE
jgi:S-disulfanyl-L-cysteine oxidoreductase SoxD